MKNLPSLEEYIKSINESFVINSEKGTSRLSKIDDEILQITLKALPKTVIDEIKEVEGHGAWSQTFETPPNIKNKSGVTSYNFITLEFKKPIGKMSSLSVGLRKRTSGPLTGYLVLIPYTNTRHNSPHVTILPGYGGIATEFYGDLEDSADSLRELYNDKIKPVI